MAKTWKKDSGSIFITLGASNHTDKEREQDDYYATDPVAIDKLLTVETPSLCVWEPAVGGGHLAERLKFLGHTVYASDIVDRGYMCELGDFLTATSTPFEDGKGDIITNPPYKIATEFVLKALDLLSVGSKCYMFLKLTFLEGKARYNKLFKNYPPKHIYAFSERVLCAKNADFDGMRASGGSAVAFAWFVWEKGYHGETAVSWI